MKQQEVKRLLKNYPCVCHLYDGNGWVCDTCFQLIVKIKEVEQ